MNVNWSRWADIATVIGLPVAIILGVLGILLA
jgi:hypothetical protein